MLFALDQKKKSDRETPPNLTYFQIPTPLSKNGLDKSCVAPSTHIVKKMHGELPLPPNNPSNPLQPPVVGVWIAEKENGYGQTNKAFCRPTPWVWQKCMENTGGSTFQWPLKLPSESNSHQTTVHSKLVHWTPFRWLLCKSVQYWLIYRLMNAGPAYLVQKMNGFLWIFLCGSAGPAFISL